MSCWLLQPGGENDGPRNGCRQRFHMRTGSIDNKRTGQLGAKHLVSRGLRDGGPASTGRNGKQKGPPFPSLSASTTTNRRKLLLTAITMRDWSPLSVPSGCVENRAITAKVTFLVSIPDRCRTICAGSTRRRIPGCRQAGILFLFKPLQSWAEIGGC